MIQFKSISQENFQAVINMEVNDNQKGFMEDNLYSLAECVVEKSFITKAINKDNVPIGFLLYYFVKDNPDYVFLHRLMIDKSEQGKGLGRAALEEAINLFKNEFPSIACVELMHYPDNKAGEALYDALGFDPTGEHRKSEPCRCEKDTKDDNRYIEIVRRKYYDNHLVRA
ncbi:GNAT family N-acetyltransferase [Aminipila butyrica]|uniref:GNAT family N-acetyltransferase n=1 Tax=Aminipila butyrica TaxID=433296 RepID=A0A858BV29_9FIRM|nr:GNAT family N-acetyltransferase [Aminipila butyrica]QIB68780.1 GNAT family N-acetyltransferase [Aminipila butyrica]